MKPITMYTANCWGNKFNAYYPVKRIVCSLDDFIDISWYDQVFAEYKDNHRSNPDFIRSDCLPFDCDNDHSEKEEDWITAEKVEAAFPGVLFYFVYSHHHMKWKGEYSPRSRFHVVFLIDPVTDREIYRTLKESVIAYFPYFDTGAKDSARFFYGVKEPVVSLHGGGANGS